MRQITRSLLASAIEYAAQSKLTPLEWQRLFVHKDSGAHSYADALMERARSETVRILSQNSGEHPLSKDARDELHKLAAGLRAGVF
jgi:hypothetical protein